jgi:PAS domain S-box-containing protein
MGYDRRRLLESKVDPMAVEEARALIESEARLSLAVAAGELGVWDWDLVTNAMTYSAEARTIYGFPADVPVSFEQVRDATHPEDLPRTMAMSRRAVDPALRENLPYEYRIVRPGGEIRWVLARGRAVFSGVGVDAVAQRYIGVIQDITQAKATALALEASEARLRESEAQLRALADNIPGGMIYQGEAGPGGERRFTFVSSNCERLHGVKAEAAMADPMALYGLISPEDLPGLMAAEEAALAAGAPMDHEIRTRGKDGARRWQRVTAAPRRLADGRVVWDGIQTDIDERKRAEQALQSLNAELEARVAEAVRERLEAEESLRQAQKMEVLGQLTGGVAHDFNNLLTIIIGGLDIIRRSAPDDRNRIGRATEMALQGAERAAGLTNRLLAFSRRHPLSPGPCDVNALIAGMSDLLRGTLGETIDLEEIIAPGLGPADVDCQQLEAAILNLALNARDAMPSGGVLRLETANADLDEDYAASQTEVAPGVYVAISITDTGHGIPNTDLGRVFEPFFTTKEVGKGTGLGLSMVYGFAKQSGGHVTIDSVEGKGTTVRLFLPRHHGAAEPRGTPSKSLAPLGRRDEVVLVVEDNAEVRTYSRSLLEELGYAVLEAAEAREAVDILKTDAPVDLLFTDVVLPGMSGRALAEEAGRLRPGLEVLFTTGYARDAIVHGGRLESGVNLIAKPFTFDQLARRVREALDAARSRRRFRAPT